MKKYTPKSKHLVLLGGGHTHAMFLLMHAMRPIPDLKITLITDVSHTPYSGMLPAYVAGIYQYDEIHIDLRRVAEANGAQFILSKAKSIDLKKKSVEFTDRPRLSYDLLSINSGSVPEDIPGKSSPNVFAVKPVPKFLEGLEDILKNVKKHPEKDCRISIVGAGVSGCEVAINLKHRLEDLMRTFSKKPGDLRISLFNSNEQILSELNEQAKKLITRELKHSGIEIHQRTSIQEISPSFLRDQNGRSYAHDWAMILTNAIADPMYKEAGFECDDKGFIATHATLQTVSDPSVFACGDIAFLKEDPCAKCGVFAVRQGKTLYKNVLRFFRNQKLIPYKKQKTYLQLIGIKGRSSIAVKGNITLQGRWAWILKDHIDRKFMRRFSELPIMTDIDEKIQRHSADPKFVADEQHRIRCSGCGAKAGSEHLEASLQQAHIEFSLDKREDANFVMGSECFKLYQTIDFIPRLPVDPYVFAKIAVNHCLSDLYAIGANPINVQNLIVLPREHQHLQEETLTTVLQGLKSQLKIESTKIIGGHTSEGDELAIGLSCNGLIDEKQTPRSKKFLEPHHDLVLTKPIGTGILFAGLMQQASKGRWIDSTIQMMLQSNRIASEILNQFDIRATTDITGFGLGGHLIEMLLSSNVSATLDLKSIPLLPGSENLLLRGIKSSLYENNKKMLKNVNLVNHPIESSPFDLLLDPQTSGGLLFGSPREKTKTILENLHAQGYSEASVIGYTLENESGGPSLAFK